MNDSYKNLLLAIEQLTVTPDPVPEYRFYFDNSGRIINCSMLNHQEGDNYVIVTKEQYDNYTKYEIKNKKLVEIQDPNRILASLVKSDTGFRVVKNHAALLLETNETFDLIEYYDSRNN